MPEPARTAPELRTAPGLRTAPELRTAIVLFNLGGPDRMEAVRPFLLNLFTDPAILRVPRFIRPFLARLIAWRRIRPAQENYRLLGGKSPLLELTIAQAAALEQALAADPGDYRCFVAMRYWHPFSLAAARAVKAWDPDRIVLLPLYPQFSSTTTASSLTAWRDAAAAIGLACDTRTLCCYPDDPAYIAATAAPLRAALARPPLAQPERLRVLFSAHGLPQTIVDRGDPYRDQIERTAHAVVAALAMPDLDWRICFQSRATPQRWLAPSIDAALHQAAADGTGVLVVPIAFVSEHSETLVELDIEYAELAQRLGIAPYLRLPAQNSDPAFIQALAALVRTRLARAPGTCSSTGQRVCPHAANNCPMLPA